MTGFGIRHVACVALDRQDAGIIMERREKESARSVATMRRFHSAGIATCYTMPLEKGFFRNKKESHSTTSAADIG